MRHNALLLILAVALGAVVLLWSHGGGTPLAAPSRLAAPAAERDAGGGPPALGAGEERAAVSRPGVPAVEAGPTRTVAGRFVVLDEEGAEHRSEEGGFRLVVWQDERGQALPIEVHEGHWSAQVPEGAALGVRELELGGRPALLAGTSARRYPLPEDGSLDLCASWLAPSVVHVRDARTQDELSGVRVVRANRFGAEDAHPGAYGPEDVLVDDGLSPVEVPHEDDPLYVGSGQGRYFVSAPGHAWRAVTFDAARTEPRTVVLQAGGDVRIEVTGASRAIPDAVLRLRRPGTLAWAPVVDVPLAGRAALRLESLPEGTFVASVELGRWTDDPRVLGSAEVEVRAGEETLVAIATVSAPELERFPLAGTLSLPDAWALDDFRLVVTRRDDTAHTSRPIRIARDDMPRDAEGRYAWDAGTVLPGLYELAIAETHTRVQVELAAPGRKDVQLEVPAPGRLSLRILDATTGRDADIDRIVWSSAGTDSVTILRNPTSARFDFRAPRGEIEVHVPTFEYLARRERLEVGEGVTDVTLELRPAARVLVRLVEGETPIPFDLAQGVTVDAQPAAARLHDGGALLSIAEPGVHEIALAPLEGYRPAAPREVEVAEGRVTELVFELERGP